MRLADCFAREWRRLPQKEKAGLPALEVKVDAAPRPRASRKTEGLSLVGNQKSIFCFAERVDNITARPTEAAASCSLTSERRLGATLAARREPPPA